MIDAAILREFRDERCVVTGGTGLIGRQVVRILCDAGARVTSVSLDDLEADPRANHVRGDLSDFPFCMGLTKDVAFVFHLAGVKGSVEVTKAQPASFFVPLLMMNTNVLEACRVNRVRKIVFTSSIGAYPCADVFREDAGLDGPPMDTFPGWAKRMAEFQIESYRIQYGLQNFAIVRPCNVYGPGDNFDPASAMVIPSLIARVYNGENPVRIWGDGSAIRDFAYSRDVAEGVVLALHYGTPGGFVNLGSGTDCTIRELVETLREVVKFDYQFDMRRPSGLSKRVMDISRARRALGYQPATNLRTGLQLTWEWYVGHVSEHTRKQNYFVRT